MIGKKIETVFSQRNHPQKKSSELLKVLRSIRTKHEQVEINDLIFYRFKKRLVYLGLKARGLFDKNRRGDFVLSFEDVTKRKTVEDRLQSMMRSLWDVSELSRNTGYKSVMESEFSLCEKFVHFAQDRLGFKRCAIYVKDYKGWYKGMVATDKLGRLVDERKNDFDIRGRTIWAEVLDANRLNSTPNTGLVNTVLYEWDGERNMKIGRGEIAWARIQTKHDILAIIHVDNGPGKTIEKNLSLIVLRAFASKATALLVELRAEQSIRRVNEELERRVKLRTEDLQKSEHKYRQLVEQASDAIIVIDNQGRIIDANESAVRLTKYSVAQLTRMSAADLVGAPTLEKYREFMETVRSGKIFRGDRPIKKRTGEIMPTELSSRMMDNGMIQMIFRDVTERKKWEKEINKLLGALRQTAALVLITDKNGVIEFANPAFLETTGFAIEEVIGKTPAILRSGRHEEAFYSDLWKTIKSGLPFHGILINKKRNGELFYEEKIISPVRDEFGEISQFISTGDDITRRILLEEQLRQSQKQEMIGRLASGLAHDFNNYLFVVRKNTEELNANTNKRSSAEREMVSDILTYLDKAEDLVHQLIDLGRKTPPLQSVPAVNLNDIVDRLRRVIRGLLKSTDKVKFMLSSKKLMVRCDEGQLTQVILNLVLNSIRSTNKNIIIKVKTGHLILRDALIHDHGAIDPGEYYWISVRDNGPGISPDILPNIFEPFVTKTGQSIGTGLGLSIVNSITRNHGGHVVCESKQGSFTEIRCLFSTKIKHAEFHRQPLLQTQQKKVYTKKILELQEKQKKLILVVDDDAYVLKTIIKILQSEGYPIISASTYFEATVQFDRMKHEGRHISLLLVDIVLPDKGGIELAGRFRQIYKKAEVIFMSGIKSGALVESWGIFESQKFIRKPFSRETLLNFIEASGHSSFRPSSLS